MTAARSNTLVIRTPEGCEFSLPLAGPIARFLGWLIDLGCVWATGEAAERFLLERLFPVSPDLALTLRFILLFVLWIGYGIVLEWWWRGRTIGKRVLGLRVVDEQGLRITFSQIVIRNLLRFADLLPGPYLVGGVSCLLTRRCQRLGDLAANTVVVRAPRLERPDLSPVLGGALNSFRQYPHLQARLRQRVSPQEARIALQTVLRRDELDPQARVDLFRDIAGHLASVVHFPQPASEGLSDEQYVRNVVDSLYRA